MNVSVGGQTSVRSSGAVGRGARVVAVGLGRDYPAPGGVVRAIVDVDLAIAPGRLVCIRGRSGSGKTTLLNLLGGLDRPTRGRVLLDGRETTALSEAELIDLRRRTVAFVFQTFGLIPILTAAENVEIPLRLVGAEPTEREARVAELLERVGLSDRAHHRPHELSGGEQQRVAIARALANRPSLLLADEPTGQLDTETGHRIMVLLRDLVDVEGMTAIVATHDPLMLDVADEVVDLSDGRVVGRTTRASGGS